MIQICSYSEFYMFYGFAGLFLGMMGGQIGLEMDMKFTHVRIIQLNLNESGTGGD